MTASGAATVARARSAMPHPSRGRPAAAPTAGRGFATAFTTFVALAAGLALLAPLEVAIAIVFLFAGPHNWLEARYMLGRLPARAGRLRGFVFLAVGGAVALAAAFAALPVGVTAGADPRLLQAAWNTALVAWVALLVELRSRTPPRFATDWVHPLAALVALAQWPWPWAFGLALVFLHPLVALAVLHRELRRSRPAWCAVWPWCLAAVAAGVLAIWAAGAVAPALAVDGGVGADVARHAGADLLAGVSSRCLVATHAFLELVHYGIWIVVLPLLGMRAAPWRLETVPLARRGRHWAGAVACLLACGLLVVGVLWACFLVDYQATRRIYFTLAVLHVLAEIPFLLRMP